MEIENCIFDIGNLLVYNPAPIFSNIKNYNDIIRDITHANVKQLLNRINKLESERKEDVIVVKLPPCETRLPREKRIPIAKPNTKWEAFAKSKGIKDKKKERMVFDEVTKSWKPAWGYNRANDEKTKNWLIELPDNANPFDDAFALKQQKRVASDKKIERAQMNNAKRAKIATGLNQPFNQISSSFSSNKEHLNKSLKEAHQATASMGKFSAKINPFPSNTKNKLANNAKDNVNKMLKSIKPKSVAIDTKREKECQLDILQMMARKEPKLNNLDKLANSTIQKLDMIDKAARADKDKSKSQIRASNKAKKYKIGTNSNVFAFKKKSDYKKFPVKKVKDGKKRKKTD
ncbi:unnamed protein product [Gordionus sp. m RMFG-2023]|uniref:ribosome biogenesis regulatory protein homolog n=1 Tax=Gordionus sp. m RMFG-2023 TaxID=3053472 RepID=UPI0030E46438